MRRRTISLVTTGMLCCAVLAQDVQTDFSGVVEGQVLNLEGLPVSQAAVCAYPEPDGTVPCGQANDEGRFSIPIPQPGKYLISAWQEKEGYANTWHPAYGPSAVPLPEVVVEEGQARQSVLIYLGPKAGKLTGQVLDAETNQPIERGKIELRHETAQTTSVLGLPYSKGQFELLVPTTPFRVKFSAAGYQDWHGSSASQEQAELFLIGSGEVQEVTIWLQPTKGGK